jgi:VanZ family protein
VSVPITSVVEDLVVESNSLRRRRYLTRFSRHNRPATRVRVCENVLAYTPPGEEIEPVRTDLPGQVEHIIAYAGSGAIAMAGYGLNRGPVRIIGWFWLYASVLEYLQNFSPGRNPAVVDFAASAFGALCGGGAVLLLWRWRSASLGPRDGA